MSSLKVQIDQKVFLETLFRILAMIEPDRATDRGKRDLEIKAEIDSLVNYLLAPQPSTTESSYPRIGVSRG